MKETRELLDLVSVGPATVRDLELLKITKVKQLVGRDADQLYLKLCKVTGQRHDPCVIDVFNAAIAQAEDPNLPREKCEWPYWSKVRKNRTKV